MRESTDEIRRPLSQEHLSTSKQTGFAEQTGSLNKSSKEQIHKNQEAPIRPALARSCRFVLAGSPILAQRSLLADPYSKSCAFRESEVGLFRGSPYSRFAI